MNTKFRQMEGPLGKSSSWHQLQCGDTGQHYVQVMSLLAVEASLKNWLKKIILDLFQ